MMRPRVRSRPPRSLLVAVVLSLVGIACGLAAIALSICSGCWMETSGLALGPGEVDALDIMEVGDASPDVEDPEVGEAGDAAGDLVHLDVTEITDVDGALDESDSAVPDVVHDDAGSSEDVSAEDSEEDVDLDGAGDVSPTCGGPWSGSDSTRVCYGFRVVAGRTYTASSCDPWSPATEVWMEGDCACVPDRDVCGSHGCTCTATATGSAMACAGCRGTLPCEWVVRIDGDCTAS